MFIRDLQGNEYTLFTDFEHIDELNTNDSIRMQIPYDKNHREFLSQTTDLEHWIIGDIVGINEYRIVYSKKVTKGNSFYVDIIANPEVIERLDELRVYKRYDQYFTDVQFFNLVFANTPFTVMINGSSASLMWEGVGDGESKLSMFKRGIKRYGFEFKIVGNVVYLYDKIGNDTNYEFRYKLNTANIVKETDSQEFFTAIRGYGNYDQDEKDIDGKALLKDTYISPLASVYGEKWAPPLRDGRVKVASTLRKEMERIVDESLKISFSADIYDLSRQGYDYQHTVLGDRVFLVDERIKEDVEVRVVKKEVKYSAKKEIIDLKLTFGTTSMTDAYKSSLQTTVKEFSEIMAGIKALPFAALDIVSRSMVSKIQNTSSELLFDDMGIHSVDKNNPNNIVTMNSSGWMLSTDGGNTAKTALTAEGMVADAITTGTLNTQLVTIVGENSLIYMNGQEIGATSNTTKSQTFIRPRGLYITRPDGAVYMQDGVPSMSFDVQPISFYADGIVTFDGRFYRTSSTNFEIFNVVYAEHSARYITFTYLADWGAESENSHGNVGLRIEEFGDLNVSAQESVLAGNNISTQQGNITLDLGTPTYKPLYFYLKIKNESGNTKNIARMRTLRVHMRG
ncbi:phage tail protein [Staphylococcus simulans]|uniref:phage tail protein n=1 Tax=Staphylococcus simulans TaxID=1286 RepID=UPI0021CF84CD|nr:phage tail protein [Staphylococcus simulans]UXR49070.1 phage tail protein [Staphylococcus simulans]